MKDAAHLVDRGIAFQVIRPMTYDSNVVFGVPTIIIEAINRWAIVKRSFRSGNQRYTEYWANVWYNNIANY